MRMHVPTEADADELLGRRTAHEFVRDTLRRKILDGSLTPGARLFQAKVAADLRVSTTPVREALRDLANEGLIDLDAHRGASVRRIDAGTLREIYDARLVVEPEVMRRIADDVTDERLGQAVELLDRMRSEDRAVEWAHLNHDFHRTLIEGASSRRLTEFIKGLQDTASAYVITALRGPAAFDEHNNEHQEIVEALRTRDGDAVAVAVTKHLRHSLRQLLELAERSDEEADVATS
jgi:DNA-binding GntR family transcriptional regulator